MARPITFAGRSNKFKSEAFIKAHRDIIRYTGVNPKLLATVASGESD
jgi:hypothetical protein